MVENHWPNFLSGVLGLPLIIIMAFSIKKKFRYDVKNIKKKMGLVWEVLAKLGRFYE
jgi:hypothetical protein